MTSSERPSPEPILEKEASPAVLGGGENSGNALEASNALNYRVWGIPAVLSREIPGNALRAFPGSFRNYSGISSGKSQPSWGYGPTYSLLQLPQRPRVSFPQRGASSCGGALPMRGLDSRCPFSAFGQRGSCWNCLQMGPVQLPCKPIPPKFWGCHFTPKI